MKAAVVAEIVRFVKEKKQAVHAGALIAMLLAALKIKDPYTHGHCKRVGRYASLIGKELGLSRGAQKALFLGGLLHDIGKLAVPDEILTKESRLTDEEYQIIKEHPKTGAEMLEGIINNPIIISMVRNHHERFGGKGYPDAIAGEEIPLAARIICAADSYDAMTSGRKYRDEHSVENALLEIERNKGGQFDPEVAEALLRVVRQKKKRT